MNQSNHFAHAAMLIHKPLFVVFEAFTDPSITTKFWFNESTGKLKEGKSVEWTWKIVPEPVPIKVLDLIKNERILIQWGEHEGSTVEWTFKPVGEGTFVAIVARGFGGGQEELISQIRESTGGFSWVLAGLKAYLEHDIQLNLIKDRYPDA